MHHIHAQSCAAFGVINKNLIFKKFKICLLVIIRVILISTFSITAAASVKVLFKMNKNTEMSHFDFYYRLLSIFYDQPAWIRINIFSH